MFCNIQLHGTAPLTCTYLIMLLALVQDAFVHSSTLRLFLFRSASLSPNIRPMESLRTVFFLFEWNHTLNSIGYTSTAEPEATPYCLWIRLAGPYILHSLMDQFEVHLYWTSDYKHSRKQHYWLSHIRGGNFTQDGSWNSCQQSYIRTMTRWAAASAQRARYDPTLIPYPAIGNWQPR